MKIIVISKTNYKEKDVIINAISETGAISFKVRGGQVPSSPFYWVNNPLSIADVEYVENVRYIHQILKSASLIYSPIMDNSLSRLLTIHLALEILNKMLQEEERHLIFKDLEDYLLATKDEKGFLLAELILLAKAIRLTGAEPEINQCVFCGAKKDIVAFSFAEGGFICRSCLQEDISIDLTPNQMNIVRFVFMVKDFSYLPIEKMNKEDLKTVFIRFRDYISDGIGINLETINHIIEKI